MASSSRQPSNRRVSPANTKLSPGMSCSMQYSSTSPSTRPGASMLASFRAPPARQPHADHRRLDNGPHIEAILLGDPGMGNAKPAVRSALQPRVSFIVGERVAAGRHELHHLVEAFAG